MKNISGKRAIVITTASNMLDQFCMEDIKILKEDYVVDVASNFMCGNSTSNKRVKAFINELKEKGIESNQIDFSRSPISLNNIRAFIQILKLFRLHDYQIVHVHTPIAAALCRVAARIVFKKKVKIVYTAHGFHFYSGAPVLNWLIYYPLEKILAKQTDVLITINKEDYEVAQKKLKSKNTEYIPGIGIPISKIEEIDRYNNFIYDELEIDKNSFVILSVGELNKNKNHEAVIKAISKLNIDNLVYLVCGQGPLENYLKELSVKYDVASKVRFLGFREDIYKIYTISNLFVFPSFREGLSVALMEAMAFGLPIICSKIRGNTDIVEDNMNGILVDPKNPQDISYAILQLKNNTSFTQSIIKNNLTKSKSFDRKKIDSVILNVYKKIE